MYLRTEVRYYQLAENKWNAERGPAVAEVVYNFGAPTRPARMSCDGSRTASYG